MRSDASIHPVAPIQSNRATSPEAPAYACETAGSDRATQARALGTDSSSNAAYPNASRTHSGVLSRTQTPTRVLSGIGEGR